MRNKCIKCGSVRRWYHLFKFPCGHKQQWTVGELDNIKVIRDDDYMFISSIPEKRSCRVNVKELKEYILDGKME